MWKVPEVDCREKPWVHKGPGSRDQVRCQRSLPEGLGFAGERPAPLSVCRALVRLDNGFQTFSKTMKIATTESIQMAQEIC